MPESIVRRTRELVRVSLLVLAVCLVASCAWAQPAAPSNLGVSGSPVMAWSRVAGATLAAASTLSTSAWNAGSLGAAVQNDDRLIASLCLFNNLGQTVLSITDSLGNTWVRLGTNSLAPTITVLHELWTTVSVAGTPLSITVNTSPAVAAWGFAVVAYRGLDTSGTPLDLALLWGKALGSATADSGTTGGTTTATNALKIGAYADDGRNFTPVAGTLDTTYTMDATNNPTGILGSALESADSGVSGSTARATMTSGNTTVNAMYVAVFKLAATATAKMILDVHHRAMVLGI